MQKYKNFEIGQWVKSCSKGIHRIEKFVPIEYEQYHFFVMQHWEQGAITADKIGTWQEPLVVLKRLFNTKLKKQLGVDFCSSTFLKNITASEQRSIDEQIRTNPQYLTQLDAYETPTFETRYGLHLLLTDETKSVIRELAHFVRQEPKTFTDLFEWLDHKNYRHLLYSNTSPGDRTAHYLQFINWNYATRDNRLLFSNLLAFTPDFIKMETT